MLSTILNNIPQEAFTLFLVDPKGWRIPLLALTPLLNRCNSEVVFNFMFDFINRAASMKDPAIVTGLDKLIPLGDWRRKLEEAEQLGRVTSRGRKAILVEAFRQSLKQISSYAYVAETTILRPLRDRALYCLFYATRHPKGIEVFRDRQVAALREESKTRAAAKVTLVASTTGQGEFFGSLHEMAADTLECFLQDQRTEAEKTLLELAPNYPHFLAYEKLWAQVLAQHVVRLPDVNKIAARLHREKRLRCPDWERGRRVPQRSYRIQRA